ncbi:MAG: Hsp20/alpha crystallin family protein [Acidobacteria bacterium]|nr:Hsp20/alpha crystallin family protein [Acidobacteriota bacterium]
MAQGTKQKREANDASQNREPERPNAGSTSQGLVRREGQGLSGRFSGHSLFDNFRNEIDRLFDDFGFGRSFLPTFAGLDSGGSQGNVGWMPQTEVFRRNNQLIVRADLPGLKKEDVNIELDDDRITIRGERKQEHEEDKDGVYRSERSYGTFYRSIPVPDGADGEKAKADFHDGVLEITMPMSDAKPKRRRLEIR